MAADGDNQARWSRRLQKAAMKWTYIVRSRERWNDLEASSKDQGIRAEKELAQLGISADAIAAIARDGLVEVSIPFHSEEQGWEARIFPWEYVIAGATRERRAGTSLTVVRHLDAGRSKAVRPGSRLKVLYVESTPGPLREAFNFETERELVQDGLRAKGQQWRMVLTPTLTELEHTVQTFRPDVVHIAGFDSHQGVRLLRRSDDDATRSVEESEDGNSTLDGYLMADGRNRPIPVPAHELAEALCAKGHHPSLVCFNLQNSAARVAAHTVAAGAGAAVGFQDEFDDTLSEQFFATFYRAWRHRDWDLLEAFRDSWETIRGQSASIRGSGLVLWSGQPLIKVVGERQAEHVRATREARRLAPRERARPWTADQITSDKVSTLIRSDVKAFEEINYSLLHNREPLFERFTLMNRSTARSAADTLRAIAGIEVNVRLSAGSETAEYRTRVTLDKPTYDLSKHIHVPLTSELMRSAHESINSTVFVEVTWGANVLYRDTHLVRLLPVDQWRDNNRDGKWLPSFVLPRDPVVGSLIDKAQRYVRVLRDDPSAGFDGYQSIDPKAGDQWMDVDRQAQAIWSMLVHELRLGYVNPPPGYNNELDSQRLRTPSMVVNDRAGTCLDLSLLFAACLELIDIYPVIFLLEGHAFPGYWRSDRHHQQFIETTGANDDDDDDDTTGANGFSLGLNTEDKEKTRVAGAQRVPWWPGKAAYDEIKRLVRLGHLVPLETVWLTEHSGFWDAVDGGKENLKTKKEFHSMLDIVRARESGVTPLPVSNGR